jgi:TonB family protein
MTRILRKIAPLGLCLCAAAWTRTGSVPVQSNDSPTTTTAQPAQSSTVAPTSGQDSPPSNPPEYKLEPLSVSNVVYPPQAREEKIEGEIVASFWVSDTGDVMSVRAFKGDPLLVKAVEGTVSKWRFKPVISDDKAITVNASASFRFILSDQDQAVNGVVPEIGPARHPQRVRVSAGVSAGLLERKVQPDYPPEAREAHIQGTVLLRAVISKDGSIEKLTLVSGHPMLAPAAIDAVKQWRYKPYLLMGSPMEVDTEIQVNFTLSYK